MIARIWRGTVREADKDTYYEYLRKTGLKEYAETPGNRGVQTLRRVANGQCEFLLLTLWDSWDAIKAFAGPDYERSCLLSRRRTVFASIANLKFFTTKFCRNQSRSGCPRVASSLCLYQAYGVVTIGSSDKTGFPAAW
jgi:heme-degrading monooxygenase HmoA